MNRELPGRAGLVAVGTTVLVVAGTTVLTSCSGGSPAVAPPTPVVPSAASTPTSTSASTSASTASAYDGDPAVVAVRSYLRQQALAVNAQVSDPARLPAFTATLTPAARGWAVPLLAANLGDEMPGPYPVGVLTSARTGDDRVEVSLCLQDRGWQVDRASRQPLNAPHYATARAVVVRVDTRWLVDDVVADGGTCSAEQVVEERF